MFFSSRTLPGQRYASNSFCGRTAGASARRCPVCGSSAEVVIEQQQNVRLPLAQRRNRHVNDVQAGSTRSSRKSPDGNPAQAGCDWSRRGSARRRASRSDRRRGDEFRRFRGSAAARPACAATSRRVRRGRACRVGERRQSGLVAVRAGEAAAHVPEQFGFEQRIGETRAVDRDERMTPPAPPNWISRATISLPTPVSPTIRTFASERAAVSISDRRRAMAALLPIKRGPSSAVWANGFMGRGLEMGILSGFRLPGHQSR